MTDSKVYIIESELIVGDPQAVVKRDNLGRAIFKLAEQTNEQVWFHEFKGPIGGAPVVLLECSDEFLGLVRNLPEFVTDHEVPPSLPTERSPVVQQYFSQDPPTKPIYRPPSPHPRP